jgi:hypothetical protein
MSDRTLHGSSRHRAQQSEREPARRIGADDVLKVSMQRRVMTCPESALEAVWVGHQRLRSDSRAQGRQRAPAGIGWSRRRYLSSFGYSS